MKILKTILYIVLGLVAVVLIVALFVKKDFSVEREITIHRPKSEVFDYVKFLKNQENYGVWYARDPGMKREYRGTDGTAGFVAAWDSESKDVGKGEQEITKITEGERIDSELRFSEPFESTSPAYMITESAGENETIVKWGFTGRMNYPMNIMLLFVDMNDAAGKDFETGLNNLKDILEKQ